jgi:6-pyruvoyltetrahydropterin/6-carboxytetrahydropterin synthase
VRVTLAGEPNPVSGYLIDIRAIDNVVRQFAYDSLIRAARGRRGLPGIVADTFELLRDAWPGRTLERLELIASAQQSAAATPGGDAMTELSQHFEFSAAHRLHNPALGDEENRQLFGKCNNPAGHGHNYEVRVTVAGTPDDGGRLIGVAELERLVETHAIDKVDHKHLNEQVPAFASMNPSVENIARVMYGWLAPHLKRPNAVLKSVTVWETPKTSCEYSG